MTRPATPLGGLIQSRMRELGLDRERLGFRLGYHNPAKAAGRVDALCSRTPFSDKSRRALDRLAAALEVSTSVVTDAVAETEELMAARAQLQHEARRLERGRDEAQWRSTFEPHAVLLTEHRRPTQITLCAFTGGAERWLTVRFDLSRSPLTFVQQVSDALPRMTGVEANGRRSVMFFGAVNGFVINYSPNQAVGFDLLGSPLRVLPTAYRCGELTLSAGHRTSSNCVGITTR